MYAEEKQVTLSEGSLEEFGFRAEIVEEVDLAQGVGFKDSDGS